jgi:hypothetical protein
MQEPNFPTARARRSLDDSEWGKGHAYLGRFGKLGSIGLRDVEDIDDTKADQHGRGAVHPRARSGMEENNLPTDSSAPPGTAIAGWHYGLLMSDC